MFFSLWRPPLLRLGTFPFLNASTAACASVHPFTRARLLRPHCFHAPTLQRRPSGQLPLLGFPTTFRISPTSRGFAVRQKISETPTLLIWSSRYSWSFSQAVHTSKIRDHKMPRLVLPVKVILKSLMFHRTHILRDAPSPLLVGSTFERSFLKFVAPPFPPPAQVGLPSVF